MKAHLLRNLYLAHRWLGIAVGVLALAWFASGVVMMYVGYPQLTPAERRAAQTPLRAEQVKVTAAAAWLATGEQGAPDSVRLANLASATAPRPAYLFLRTDKWHAIWADTGQPRAAVSARDAAHAAQAIRDAPVLANDRIDVDQWTLGNLNAHRPLYRIELGDARHSILYVSSTTGEVVRDTDRFERGWNWVGSVIHWIYFTPLRVAREPWRQVVMWTSATVFLLALSGSIVGLLRLRIRRRYSHGRMIPYSGWQRWHHLLGIGISLSALCWLFSGWLSVNPFNMFASPGITRADRLALAAGALTHADLGVAPAKLLSRSTAAVVEMEWSRFDGETYVKMYAANNASTFVSTTNAGSATLTFDRMIAAAQRLRPAVSIADTAWLEQGDLYYYRHHDEKPLPVMRVDFADADATSFYIDATTGQLASHVDNNSRLNRWLFNGLHQLDFPFLIQHRPVWDVVVILLCALGASLSLSGLVIGWRRLRKSIQ